MSNINKVAKSLKKSIQSDKQTKPYDTQAEIVRVEGSTAWVQIPGGVDETPVKLTTSAKPGDVVQVRVSGGRAWLTGNETAPPTDDTRAIQAQTIATDASRNADIARNAADSAVASAASASASATTAYNKAQEAVTSATNAQTSANNALASAKNASDYASRALGNLSTVQSVAETLTYITAHGTMTLTTDVALDPTHVYFVVDPAGDYTVNSVTYAIVTEPNVADISTYYELTIDESLQNYVGTHLALTQEGLWLLPAGSGTNKVLIATGAGSTYTVAGTYLIDSSGGTVASFRADGTTITNGTTEIAHLGYGPGNNTSGGTSNTPYYSFGERGGTVGNYSTAMGHSATRNGVTYPLTASGSGSVAEGYGTTSSGVASHAEGYITTASNDYAHAEGTLTTASNTYSHAEGREATASGQGSHAEGFKTTASGTQSHAEGLQTTASGNYSHAEGSQSTASGDYSHAQNYYAYADQSHQTAIGKYNSKNLTNNLFVIGNGTADNARSDAFKVDTSGNVDIASGAKYKINGTNLSASDVGAVPTTRTVNSKALSSNITLSASDVGALASSSVADYITSKGTSGSWYYEKYASGKIEAVFRGSVTYGTMSASGQLYRSTNNAVAIPSGIFTTTPTRTEITINNASTVVVCATAVASSTTNVNVQVWRSTNASSSIDATIRCTYTP